MPSTQRGGNFTSTEQLAVTLHSRGVETEDQMRQCLTALYKPGFPDLCEALVDEAIEYLHWHYILPWSRGPV